MGDILRSVGISDEVKEGLRSGDDEDYGLFGDIYEGEEGSLAGYTAELDTATGEETFLRDIDFGKAATAIGEIGKYDPPSATKGSRVPDLPDIAAGRISRMAVESPYAAPSYLAGSVDYNKMVGQLVNTLLKGNIRPRRINPLL